MKQDSVPTQNSLILRLALRELRASLREGLQGFRIFLACLALGVAAIAGVGSVSSSLTQGLAENGQEILGGDIDIRLTQREATESELQALIAGNTLSRSVEMRAMARTAQDEQRLVELKAVDDAYPLYGAITLTPSMKLDAALSLREGLYGVVVEPSLAARLSLKIDDEIRIGDARFQLRAMISHEPDRIGDGFSLGPRAMIALAGLASTHLLQPGSLVSYHYQLMRPADARGTGSVKAYVKTLNDRFPDAGWRVQDRTDSAPGLRRFVDQAALFLTFVGLTTLAVGGVGIATGVTAYLDRKRDVIAIMKSLGATGGFIFRLYFLLIMMLALCGTLIGLAIGAALPFLLSGVVGDLIPMPVRLGIYPGPLLLAALYGLLTASAFAVWPLGRTRDMRAASIFRDLLETERAWPSRLYVMISGLSIAALAALAIGLAERPYFALWFVAGIALAFLLLRLAALGVMGLARRFKGGTPDMRLALANLHRPGAPTPSIMLSLGLGLTLLVTMASINGNITQEMTRNLPERAPSFFFVDIQPDQIASFETLVRSVGGVSKFERVPMLRGRITRIKGAPISEKNVPVDARWVLRGDRGVTYSVAPPENSEIVSGSWWPKDYSGPLLVSFDDKLAQNLGLKLGDTLTVNVLGRDIEARLANTREIHWQNLGINFVMVFSPGVLEAAPHSELATVTMDEAGENRLEREVAKGFPNVSAVRVKEALSDINVLLQRFATGLNVTGGLTLLAGMLVLGGAVAADFRKRQREAALLKVLGATRLRVIGIYAREYALLGLATSLIAGFAGSFLGYLVVAFMMDFPWRFLPLTLVATSLGATLLTLLFGLFTAWRALSAQAAAVLRAE